MKSYHEYASIREKEPTTSVKRLRILVIERMKREKYNYQNHSLQKSLTMESRTIITT